MLLVMLSWLVLLLFSLLFACFLLLMFSDIGNIIVIGVVIVAVLLSRYCLVRAISTVIVICLCA